MFKKVGLTILIAVVVLLYSACSLFEPPPETNKAPVISSISVNPQSPDVDSDVSLSCDVTDPDGDAVTYAWSVTDGILSATDMQNVTWTTPSDPVTVTVILTASDGRDTTQATRTVAVNAVSNHAPVINTITANPSSPYVDTDVALSCDVTDSDGDNLTYIWSATQGLLSSITGANVLWTTPSTPSDTVSITLTVSDGTVSVSDTLTVTVSEVPNTAPVINTITANPSSPYVNTDVALSCDVDDAEDDTLTYSWSVSQGVLSSTSVPNPTWTTPSSAVASVTITLTVSDGTQTDVESITTSVREIPNGAPVINSITANPVSPYVDSTVTLSSSVSDLEGDEINYSWSVSAGTLTTTDEATVTWTTPATAQDVTVTLIADDGANSSNRSMTITVAEEPNEAPMADAGANQTVVLGDTVTLSGTATDADGDTLTYLWNFKNDPPASGSALDDEDIHNKTTLGASFTPDAAGFYTLVFTVSDGKESASDEVTISVNENQSPSVEAGVNQTQRQQESGLTAVVFDATASDPEGEALTYEWTFDSKPAGSALLNGDIDFNDEEDCRFTPDRVGEYVLRLVVTDSFGNSSYDTVTLTVEANHAPAADAGDDAQGYTNVSIALDGSGSTDDEGDDISYAWEVVSKPSGAASVFSDATAAHPDITLDTPGAYTIRLTASDWNGSATDDVTLTIISNPAVPANGSAGETDYFELGLTWDADSEASSFNVYWSDTTGVTSDNGQVINTGTNSLTFDTPLSNTDYYFVLTAVRSDGSETDDSAEFSGSASALPAGPLSISSLDGPMGGEFRFVTASGTNVVVMTEQGEFLLSENEGATWSDLYTYDLRDETYYVSDILLIGDYLFISSYYNQGGTKTGTILRMDVTAGSGSLTDITNGIGVSNMSGVLATQERYDGSDWQPVLYASMADQVYYTSNFDEATAGNVTWTSVTTNGIKDNPDVTSTNNRNITDIAVNYRGSSSVSYSSYIFVLYNDTLDGNYTSDRYVFCADLGDTDWEYIEAPLPVSAQTLDFDHNGNYYYTLLVSGASGGSLEAYALYYHSPDTTPIDPPTDFPDNWGSDLISSEGAYAGTAKSNNRIYLATDRGELYEFFYFYSPDVEEKSIDNFDSSISYTLNRKIPFAKSDANFFLGSTGLYYRANSSDTENWKSNRQPVETIVHSMANFQGKIALGTSSGLHFYDPDTDTFESTDVTQRVKELYVYDDTLYVGAKGETLYVYTDTDSYTDYTGTESADTMGIAMFEDVLYMVKKERALYSFSNGSFSIIEEIGTSPSDHYTEFFSELTVCNGYMYALDLEDSVQPVRRFNPESNFLDDVSITHGTDMLSVGDMVYVSSWQPDGGSNTIIQTIDTNDSNSVDTLFSSSWQPADSSCYALATDNLYIYSLFDNGNVYRCDLDGSNGAVYASLMSDHTYYTNYSNGSFALDDKPMSLLVSKGVLYIGSFAGGLYIAE